MFIAIVFGLHNPLSQCRDLQGAPSLLQLPAPSNSTKDSTLLQVHAIRSLYSNHITKLSRLKLDIEEMPLLSYVWFEIL